MNNTERFATRITGFGVDQIEERIPFSQINGRTSSKPRKPMVITNHVPQIPLLQVPAEKEPKIEMGCKSKCAYYMAQREQNNNGKTEVPPSTAEKTKVVGTCLAPKPLRPVRFTILTNPIFNEEERKGLNKENLQFVNQSEDN